jgi:VanZ family protein
MGRKILRYFILVGVLLIIYFSFFAEAERITALGGDKLWHVLAFGFLGLTGAVAFPRGRRLVMVIVGLAIFGLAIESVQFVMPGRSAHFSDIVANLAGLSSGLVLAVSAKLLISRRIGDAS